MRNEFGAEVYSTGPSPIIFIEGYQVDEERTENGNDRYAGFVRSYRATIHVKNAKGKWAPQSRILHPGAKPKRYRPTHMLVKLYAFHPQGDIYWRKVFLRKVKTPPPERQKSAGKQKR